MSDAVLAAEKFAEKKHKGQKDKAGVPYIEHPRFVAAQLDGEQEKIVAWLHDTVEDTDATIEEIRAEFGDDVAEAVNALTRRDAEPYMEYIARLKKNDLARAVKMADLKHNMDTSRLKKVRDEDMRRVGKYEEAYAFLMQ